MLLAVAALLYFTVGKESASETVENNVDMLAPESELSVNAESVAYFEDVEGYYAAPAEEGNYPGVVMIHEWWGLNDNIRDMAENLAAEGYRVLAVDLYSGDVASTSSEAMALRNALNQDEAISNMQAAADFLRSQGSDSIGSLGWCFGGGQSLSLALSGEELDATVIYYGTLVTDRAQLASIDWPVLGIFGEEDSSIPVQTVNEFGAALDASGIENEIYIYPGVGHAFANPSGANYAPEPTIDAWQKTLAFLGQNLK